MTTGGLKSCSAPSESKGLLPPRYRSGTSRYRSDGFVLPRTSPLATALTDSSNQDSKKANFGARTGIRVSKITLLSSRTRCTLSPAEPHCYYFFPFFFLLQCLPFVHSLRVCATDMTDWMTIITLPLSLCKANTKPHSIAPWVNTSSRYPVLLNRAPFFTVARGRPAYLFRTAPQPRNSLQLAPDTTHPQPVIARPVQRSTVRVDHLATPVLGCSNRLEASIASTGRATAYHTKVTTCTSLTCRGRIAFHCSAPLFVIPRHHLENRRPLPLHMSETQPLFRSLSCAGSEPPFSAFNSFPSPVSSFLPFRFPRGCATRSRSFRSRLVAFSRKFSTRVGVAARVRHTPGAQTLTNPNKVTPPTAPSVSE